MGGIFTNFSTGNEDFLLRFILLSYAEFETFSDKIPYKYVLTRPSGKLFPSLLSHTNIYQRFHHAATAFTSKYHTSK